MKKTIDLLAKKIGVTKKGQTVGVAYINRDEITAKCAALVATGMTQGKAAATIGISGPTLSRWLQEDRRAARDAARR